MPVYKCDVLDEIGNKKVLVKEAIDEISLKAFLKRDSYTLVKATIVKEKEPNVFFSVSSKVKISEVTLFLRQFAVMINASISIADALNALKVDSLGLDDVDIRYLKGIIDRFKGGPVGIESIAAAIGEEEVTLEDVYEPYLLQQGLINRTPRGRMVTEKAYKHLKIPHQSTLF